MDGQVLGGGVVILVAVLLWLVYLLPSIANRHRFETTERNAVRLGQALRVLAETSEGPREVQLDLDARTALDQRRLARRVETDRRRAEKEQRRLAADQRAARFERARVEMRQIRQAPHLRQIRARRRTRFAATLILGAGLGLAGFGVWAFVSAATVVWLVAGIVASLAGLVVLRRISVVARRQVRRVVVPVAAVVRERVEPVLHDQGPALWTPRQLPQPLTSVTGSRAAVAQASAQARLELERAAREEALRARAEELRPAPVRLPITASSDDGDIEAHVRTMLARRAAG